MKRITKDELEVFLRKHKLWLVNDSEGERANLQRANLQRADLRGANLQRANLRGANLQRANLQRANLQGANLQGANLWGADLWGANLQGADLWGANLQRADLWGANLRGANLQRADLWGANLWGANLWGADLWGANLQGAENFSLPIACPEEGSFIAFKKTNGCIVKLEIPEDALRCSASSRKCRCSKAKVISITNPDGTDSGFSSIPSSYDSNFIYTVGEMVEEPGFNPDRWNECSRGIHFFITRQEAVDYIN